MNSLAVVLQVEKINPNNPNWEILRICVRLNWNPEFAQLGISHCALYITVLLNYRFGRALVSGRMVQGRTISGFLSIRIITQSADRDRVGW